ncbi:nucleotidyl transferase AbiEii/AbiGii toxin family protein [Candidatus Woesearchaeota archaeon]|nr:nucleotidyl transferase AbiEii/AbiGii toxin family protein [Candidatus Woesearchaeota archaeon]
MITRRALEELARKQKLSLGNAEKDYLLDLVLRSIAQHCPHTLVFKGGTCLYKFHQLPRFSEDLDFSGIKMLDINDFVKKILADLEKEGVYAKEHTRKEPYNSVLITLQVKGPLLSENPSSSASVGIDINFKSEVVLPIEQKKYVSIYLGIGEISILGMKPEEMFAEKLRALLTRFKARDLFDIYFLINQDIWASRELIQAKMNYYQEIFSLPKILERIDVFEPIWDKEISGLTKNTLSFEAVSAHVKQKLREKYA